MILILSSVYIMPVFASNTQEIESKIGCNVMGTIAEGETVLVSDDSYMVSRGQWGTVNVNRTYNIRIQNNSGTCATTATLKVTGTYDVEIGNVSNVSNIQLNTYVSYAPLFWTVSITGQRYSAGSNNVTVVINYSSSVNDPMGCMVGGGPWYSGVTFTV